MRKSLVIFIALSVSAIALAGSVQNPYHKVVVSTRNKDDKIIINNEYIGKGSATLNISDVADTYTDDGSIVRAKGAITIEALPGSNGGCHSSVRVKSYDRVPKSVFLDTNICQQQPSIDVNIR